MKTLDHNQKARLADYLNGRPVNISDEELQMLADDDQLAAECIEIAEIAAEASQGQGVVIQFPKNAKKTSSASSNKTIRTIILAAAACLIIALAIPLFIKSDGNNTNGDPSSVASADQPSTPRKRSMGILSAKSLDKGYYEMPAEFSKMIQSASAKGFFDFEPETPFDIIFSAPVKPDTLYLCSPRVKTPLMTLPVSGESVTISPGLASGLYYYYLKYNLKERNAIAIGTDDESAQ
ncbi:MAG: hypothetical protein IKP73_06765 [Bacteroidales bacterium]|nr:hypothetical protein [Bacteroidales bacterium]